ncbi:MAG: phosphate ABC transporter permease PstA, partial [Actinobacteria bacterium ATB1]|nr:phosphate ABC transporter permease PstA [Actinobacteria bacterium ATB1]
MTTISTYEPDLAVDEVVHAALTGKGSRDVRGIVFQLLLLFTLLFTLGILLALLFDVFRQAIPVFRDRGLDFVTSGLSSRPERAGVWQGIVGSFLTTAFVVVVAFPLGVAAAVYLEEYAPESRFTRFVNLNIRNLAGVPSVVYGILGLAIFVGVLRDLTGGRSMISGGLTLAVLVMPIVVITTAESLRAVPRSLREGGFGLGATRWEVVRTLVLPYAMPGILTGTILSIARAIGEAAPLILVGAVTGFFASASGSNLWDTLRDSF